jgi:hypothetical protein
MIRTLITILILLLAGQVIGQNLDSLVKSIKTPSKWSKNIENKTIYFREFEKNVIAIVTFSYLETKVSYYVFKNDKTDTVVFQKAFRNYIMAENCQTKFPKNWNEILGSFDTKYYYFLLQHCPCLSVDNPECGKLAITLNKWKKRNKKNGSL